MQNSSLSTAVAIGQVAHGGQCFGRIHRFDTEASGDEGKPRRVDRQFVSLERLKAGIVDRIVDFRCGELRIDQSLVEKTIRAAQKCVKSMRAGQLLVLFGAGKDRQTDTREAAARALADGDDARQMLLQIPVGSNQHMSGTTVRHAACVCDRGPKLALVADRDGHERLDQDPVVIELDHW